MPYIKEYIAMVMGCEGAVKAQHSWNLHRLGLLENCRRILPTGIITIGALER
jgi:hypothetical protein